MNITNKIKLILEVAGGLQKTKFCFTHENTDYVLDITGATHELYLVEEYKAIKRRSDKLANYNKIKAEKVLWVNEDGDKLGYGEEGRLKSLELANFK